jgi:hypothetical protein
LRIDHQLASVGQVGHKQWSGTRGQGLYKKTIHRRPLIPSP